MPRLQPGSISALSRLANPLGRGNAGFDPTGADAEQQDAEYQAGADVEARTGLNPTAMQARGLRELQGESDALDTQRDLGRQAVARGAAAMTGPEGWARTSPAMAELDNHLAGGRAALEQDVALAPMAEGLKTFESERGAERQFFPEASALHTRGRRETLENLDMQYGISGREKERKVELDHQDKMASLANALTIAITNARSGDERNRLTALQRLVTGEQTNHVATPDAQGHEAGLDAALGPAHPAASTPAPGATGTVRMRSPLGREDDVPANQVQHYLDQGAVVIK